MKRPRGNFLHLAAGAAALPAVPRFTWAHAYAVVIGTTIALFATAFLPLPASADFVQQGPKLVGAGPSGVSLQGTSVATSADGNTAIIGGNNDSADTGAAWVFTRTNGLWTQQGGKLLGSGAVGAANQGDSVALSADGNTAIIGGPVDNGSVGAAWVFTRSGGVWTQRFEACRHGRGWSSASRHLRRAVSRRQHRHHWWRKRQQLLERHGCSPAAAR
jgi:hypothetical protein